MLRAQDFIGLRMPEHFFIGNVQALWKEIYGCPPAIGFVGENWSLMEEKGSKGVTARMCKDKFKNLKSRYKAIISRRKNTETKGAKSKLFFVQWTIFFAVM